MVSFLDFEGSDPVAESREAAEHLASVKAKFAKTGHRAFVFGADSPEEFDVRMEMAEIREHLEALTEEAEVNPETFTASLRREFIAQQFRIRGDDSISELYEVAEDHEADILDDLRRRAGHTWECPDCWTNTTDIEDCENCGKPRDYQKAIDSVDPELQP